MKIRPSAIAGEAYTGSPTEFVPSTSCFGPAFTINVSQSSLVIRILPSNATGDAVNVAGIGIRPPSYFTSPVFASIAVRIPRSVVRYRYSPYRIGEGTYAVPLAYVQVTFGVPVR